MSSFTSDYSSASESNSDEVYYNYTDDARSISPDAKRLHSGCNGFAYDLGDGRVVKFVSSVEYDAAELEMARHIMANPDPSVIPVLEVGKNFYIMAKGEFNKSGFWPDVSVWDHYDTARPDHNVVWYDNRPVWIDLDGIFRVTETRPATEDHKACAWGGFLPNRMTYRNMRAYYRDMMYYAQEAAELMAGPRTGYRPPEVEELPFR